MTKGLIDSASIHGALAALSVGSGENLSVWDRQSLLDTTYLLLFHEMGIVPGPGGYRGASGPFSHVISRLPSLENRRFDVKQAVSSTKAWLTKKPDALRKSLEHLHEQQEFQEWLTVCQDLFWMHHVRMHHSLFNPEFVPQIARTLEISETDLSRINRMSEDENTVRHWLKTNIAGEDARLASEAYVAAALIRGREHEYLAQMEEIHLASHPFRKSIARPLKPGAVESVWNSEEYFVKIIVGSAVIETTEERRVATWVDNVLKARQAIDLKQIDLLQTPLDSDAERRAAEAARTSGISTSYARVRRELDVAAALLLSGLLTLGVSPWAGPLGPILTAGYRHYRRSGVGDDLARLMDTTRRFRTLGRTIPGRIIRTFKTPTAPAAKPG